MDLKFHQSKPLDTFCSKRSFFRAKIGFLTFYSLKFPVWAEVILLIFEYAQLMSQAILLNPNTFDFSTYQGKFIVDVIVYLLKFINPSFLLTFNPSDALTKSILTLIFVLTLIKYCLFLYICVIAYWNLNGNQLLVSLWRWTFKIQARVFYFYFASFWALTIIKASTDEFRIYGIAKFGIIAICTCLLVIEYLFSVFLEVQFYYMLPTKNLLASKNYHIQLLTLSQKFVVHIIHMACKFNSLPGSWIINTLNLIFCVFRNFDFYNVLPLYNVKALFLLGDLLATVTSLNIACFLETFLETIHAFGANINFTITLWTIISILMIKVHRGLLKETLLSLLTTDSKGASPELLVHKISATKQFRKIAKLPSGESDKSNFAFLATLTQSINMRKVFGLSWETIPDFTLSGKTKKDVMKKIFLQYIEDLVLLFPNNSFIKVYRAHMCIKNSEPYSKTIKIASELGQKRWAQSYLSSSFLLYEIEKAILKDSQEGEVSLNLIKYIKNQLFIMSLRNEMLHQTELKIQICDNIIQDISNIGTIFDAAQEIYKLKKIIQKKINILPHSIPDYFVSPLLLCAEYSLLFNYSLKDYEEYNKAYAQKCSKYEKYFEALHLIEENAYQDKNAFLLVSGQKINNGQILFSTKQIQQLCGGEQANYIGSHISTIFTPSLRAYYDSLFKNTLEKGKDSQIKKTIKAYLYHKQKHIIETEFYMGVHPYVTQDLCLNMVIRATPSNKEYLIVKEDGEIETATKEISKKLGLNFTSQKSQFNIKSISQELSKANEAINTVYRSQQAENLNTQANSLDLSGFTPSSDLARRKYFDIFNTFTSDGKLVKLISVQQQFSKKHKTVVNTSHVFHCTISVINSDSSIIKLVGLQEITNKDGDNGFSEFGALKLLHKEEQEQILLSWKTKNLEEEEDEENLDDQQELSENFAVSDERNFESEFSARWKNDNPIMITDGNLITLNVNTQGDAPLISPRSTSRPLITIPHQELMILNEDGQNSLLNAGGQSSLENNLSNKKSAGRSNHNAFDIATNTKTYPKSFNILCAVFYIIIIVTFVSQVLLKITSDKTMKDLVLKKDLLKYAQQRSYQGILLQINALAGAQQLQGSLDAAINLGMAVVVRGFTLRNADFQHANKQILSRIDELDQDIQSVLFKKDIRIYGSYLDAYDTNSALMNNFEAVGVFSSAAYKFVKITNFLSSTSLNILAFLINNLLNDFLYQNNEMTELFEASVESQKQVFENTIVLCLIVTPFLLTAIALALVLIVWYQYTVGKNHLLAFIKLKPIGVKKILKHLKEFRKSLINEETFTNKQILDFNDEPPVLAPEIQDQDHNIKDYFKKHNNQIVKSSEFRAKHYKYVLKVIFFIAVLVSLMLWNYISSTHSKNEIYHSQTQLEFANHISTRVSVGFGAFAMLFVTNNTAYVEHKIAYQCLTDQLSEVLKILPKIPNAFAELDGSYDPRVKEVIYENTGCYNFDENPLYYCTYLRSIGQPTNLLPTVSYYIDLIKLSLLNYDNVKNSTKLAIQNARDITINKMVSTFDVIAAEAQLIAEYIDENMNKSIKNANYQRSLNLILFSISLVIIGVLIWFQVFRKLREVDNSFKRVLQVFPSNLVLSSFLLKTFLRRTSKDAVFI